MAVENSVAKVNLSPREKQVLDLAASGLTDAQISDVLGISPHTVDSYVRRIFTKFGTNDRHTAIVLAHQHNIVITLYKLHVTPAIRD